MDANDRCAIVVALLACAFFQASFAEKCGPKWVETKIFARSSTDVTVAKLVNENPSHSSIVRFLVAQLEHLGRRQLAGDPETGGFWPCEQDFTLNQRQNSVSIIIKHQGLGDIFKCVTTIRDDQNDPRREQRSKELFNGIQRFANFLQDLAPRFISDYGLKWSRSETLEVLNYNVPDVYRQCKLSKVLSFREKSQWYVSALFTNESVIAYIREGRGTFNEALGIDPQTNKVRSLQFSTPTCDKDGNITTRTYGTGLLSLYQGLPSTSHFAFLALEENPGIQAAIQKGEHQKELVEDSDTISNDALVLLPTLLALVPIGLFQDVSLSLTVLYIIATDVISVMPLLIKGIELIVYGSNKHYATVSHIYGSENATDLAVAETWSAVCSMRSFVRKKGLILVCISVSAICSGIFLEFLTRYLANKYKREIITPLIESCDIDYSDNSHSIAEQLQDGGGLLWYRHRSRTVQQRNLSDFPLPVVEEYAS